jgi:outer membrane lipoprotein-sorting protein
MPAKIKMQRIKIAISIFVLCMICSAWARPGVAGSLAEIRAAAEGITSVKGDFIQEKHMPILARPLVARGYFAYQRPASLRWEYRQPLHSVLLLHNGEAHRFIQSDAGWQEDSEAAMQSMDFILQEIAKWLNGRFDDNPLFNVTLDPDDKIVMTPKDKGMDQFIQRIELIMSDRPGIIKEVIISENADSFTRFTFVDPKINEPVAPAEFQKVQ